MFPINRPVFEFVSNSTESPAILKSARWIVVRAFELKMRVFKSSTDVLMKVHLKQIPSQGLHLSGEEDCPIQELASEEIQCAGPLHYDIDVGVADGGLWANGSLSQPVELRCVSCLQKFVHEIQVPAFAVHTELHGPETVDLTPFVREDLLLNLPAHPHCDRDGDRVCKAKQLKTEGRDANRKPDWSALDKLKLNR